MSDKIKPTGERQRDRDSIARFEKHLIDCGATPEKARKEARRTARRVLDGHPAVPSARKRAGYDH